MSMSEDKRPSLPFWCPEPLLQARTDLSIVQAIIDVGIADYSFASWQYTLLMLACLLITIIFNTVSILLPYPHPCLYIPRLKASYFAIIRLLICTAELIVCSGGQKLFQHLRQCLSSGT
jgi:hypothetical protein